MGKSASCFKICGSDSVDHDDLQNPGSKGSSDRRGWSFRKRSASHRVLSNNVASEAASSANKESPESTAVNFTLQSDLSVPEKTSVIQCNKEKAELSPKPDLNLSDTSTKEDDNRTDASATLDEHSIIVIQSAIRRLLARKVILKQKNVIKLQAAVRGHVVRSQAVGTLRCIQTIIKMQALVRARRASLLVEGSDVVKQSESSGKDNHDSTVSTILSKKEANSNGAYTYVSIEKLVSNAFARQLMESTPKTKPLNIKCDPLKSDSAWKWLERWMSVSSVSNNVQFESGYAAEQHEKENLGDSDGKEDVLIPSDSHYESAIYISGASTSDMGTEIDDNLISCHASNLDLSAGKPISPSSGNCKLQSIGQSNSVKMKETDMTGEVEVDSLPEKEECGSERDIPDSKDFSTEQPETEAKEVSKKISDPAFIAAKSKFEELSSAVASAKLTTSSSRDHEAESSLDKISLAADQPLRPRDRALADKAMSKFSVIQNGDSECGTELSISSTLDSPDTLEAGAIIIEHEPISSDDIADPRSRQKLELEANGKSGIIPETDTSCTNTDKQDMNESINSATGEFLNCMIVADSYGLQKKTGTDLSDLQLELEPEAKASPESSPRSHVTAPESQVTPSSQLSNKPKKNKGEKHESHHKSRSSSTDKKSLSKRNHDSASKSSVEQLQKEHKTARRNSIGSAKLDHKEQELRDSTSSSSLPSYMQATESARAKAIASGSPRSSPDVHDKDVYIKKRQSLPGTNERQVSPNIQRSLSQAQQNAKGIGTHSPQDRKWQR